ncbi:hypothetical protein [Paenirhodobacter enshiensis]|uniref:Uncharacterized protein n=1 Tax=Paenirhodobacter enshiensis TaxID=1105367 RepID=A0A086XSZ8_9RHOB|nr:hypothetical protein [Paenirhodobacter enshiensis]KFI25148.1 hypothetical protein CG50_06200 [Paenirhodobacter enshiensis]
MSYWTGSEAAIAAANAAAWAAYIADYPTAEHGGETVANPTTAWAEPAPTVAGDWAIPAYPGMTAPEGCREVAAVEWASFSP